MEQSIVNKKQEGSNKESGSKDLNQRFGISGGVLKLIAIITMAIDHTAATLVNVGVIDYDMNSILRTIGRIAFPIFCFLLVEGFVHTRNRMNYAIRLAIFAFISEIPFDLAFYGTKYYSYHQNVFFTLLIGFIALMIIDRWKDKEWVGAIASIAAILLADYLSTDYSGAGVVIILLLYLSRGYFARVSISVFLFAKVIMGSLETYAILALIPIKLYNGKRGFQIKYLFYAFYPVHLLFLYFLTHYIIK